MDKYSGIMNESNYVTSCTPMSPLVWDLEYFDRLIFVAQSVRLRQITISMLVPQVYVSAASAMCKDI
jgi:hypothetical protein